LNVVQVPVPPVEAVIALSIVFLAVEIARESRDTLTYRYPIAVSSSFGLLHGFGFAAVLGQIGLPQTEVPTALLFFNVGVEIGQLAFIAALIVLLRITQWVMGEMKNDKELAAKIMTRMHRPVAYVIGSIAAFWMIQRVMGFWA